VAPAADEPAEQPRALVLVIDDEPVACEMFTRMLAREGVPCRAALDGESGVQLARELRPDLIMLDVLMPSVDGWAVLSKLKSDPDRAGSPVIRVSVTENQAMGVALGASDFLVKPVDREQLVRALDKHMQRSGERTILVVEDD